MLLSKPNLLFKCNAGRSYRSHRNFSSGTFKSQFELFTNPSKRGIGLLFMGAGAVVLGIGFAFARSEDDEKTKREKLVILGAGWGAVSCIRELDTSNFDVTIVAPKNYFLYTPLLPSVTVGTIDKSSITEPIHSFIYGKPNVQFFESKCVDIDPATNTVTCEAPAGVDTTVKKFKLDYDKLVVAVGSVNNTFGTPGVYERCHFLKTIEDAVTIQKHIIECFERASLPGQPEEEVRRLLHFVVVGGGPNGVEFAAELNDYIKDTRKYFPHLQDKIKISLIELLDHVLNTYDKRISEYTENLFVKNQINVQTRTRVIAVDKTHVVLEKMDTKERLEIPFECCVWATGIGPSPLLSTLVSKMQSDQTNKRALLVDEHMKLLGSRNIFAIGDCASIEQKRLLNVFVDLFKKHDQNSDGFLDYKEFLEFINKHSTRYPQLEEYGKKIAKVFYEADVNKDGRLSLDEFKSLLTTVDAKLTVLPATAQVASQEGRFLGRHLNAIAAGKDEAVLPGFRYRHLGSLAYVGEDKAVADLGNYVLKGYGAWWFWKSVYLSQLYTVKCRCKVALDWVRTTLFGRDLTNF